MHFSQEVSEEIKTDKRVERGTGNQTVNKRREKGRKNQTNNMVLMKLTAKTGKRKSELILSKGTVSRDGYFF
jgi:hypothetical protein